MSEIEAWIQLLFMLSGVCLIYPAYHYSKKLGYYIGLWIIVIIYFAKGGKVHYEEKDDE